MAEGKNIKVKPYLFYRYLPDPEGQLQGVELPRDWRDRVPDEYDTLGKRTMWRQRCRLKEGEYTLVKLTPAEYRALPAGVRADAEARGLRLQEGQE